MIARSRAGVSPLLSREEANDVVYFLYKHPDLSVHLEDVVREAEKMRDEGVDELINRLETLSMERQNEEADEPPSAHALMYGYTKRPYSACH
jgi:hypothetical protein